MSKNLRIKTSFEGKDKLSGPMSRMERNLKRMRGTVGKLSRGFKKLGRGMMKVGKLAGKTLKLGLRTAKIGFGAAALGAGALAFAIKKVADSFSLIEDAEAAFTPLLGGTKKAKELVDKLNKTAATTPFQFETLAGTAMQLLPSMNGDIDKTIKLTRMLGDTAGGNGQKMESITRGYNKALIKGKVDMESLNMIAEAGVPIFQELGKTTGLTGEQLFKKMRQGKISVEDLTETFEGMTSKGGIFFKGMEIASETLSGKISTMKDNVILAMAGIGEALAPTLKELADDVTVIAKKVLKWVKANKGLIKSKFKEYVTNTITAVKNLYKWTVSTIKTIRNWISDNKQLFFDIWDGMKRAKDAAIDLYGWIVDNKQAFFDLWGVLKSVVTVGFEIVKFFVNSKEAVLALIAAFATFKILMFAGKMKSLAIATAGVGKGSASRIASMTGGLFKMLGVVGALVVMYETLNWAASQFDRARDLKTKRENLATDDQRRLAKDNVKQFTDKGLAARFKLQKDIQTDLSSKIATGGGTIEDEAQLEGMRGNTEKLMREIARRSAGGEREPLITNSSTTEKTEIVIKDETGRASVTKGGKSKNLELVQTGAF
jgi:tape measure domain-containing protein